MKGTKAGLKPSWIMTVIEKEALNLIKRSATDTQSWLLFVNFFLHISYQHTRENSYERKAKKARLWDGGKGTGKALFLQNAWYIAGVMLYSMVIVTSHSSLLSSTERLHVALSACYAPILYVAVSHQVFQVLSFCVAIISHLCCQLATTCFSPNLLSCSSGPTQLGVSPNCSNFKFTWALTYYSPLYYVDSVTMC